ncbi:hypothetical protein AC578_941 [Pseudocercospora eumusae]|uniref:FAD/NAD(P)-binding domain-containing protein n=1 Tax=Pseudocercospora eumusae TaxID=321146 RepID=A0A139GV75_9PEZI|nr:hypothetical protein AC578_941 [Pseudocercospora eumusae]KXS94105.1 hypothetical protein AC578_941 [Pseudocercospora eumusae]
MGAQKDQTPIRILVAGGAYAGISFITNFLDLCSGRPPRSSPEQHQPSPEALKGVNVDIHLVDERDGYFHLIGSPLAFASPGYAEKIWQRFVDIPAPQHPAVRISQASLEHIDTNQRVARIKDKNSDAISEHAYDYFVAATGVRRVWPVVPQELTRKRYLKETADHAQSIRNATQGVVVIGGGAVGVEMAAEMKVVEPSINVTLVHSRDQLLSAEPLPNEVKQMSLDCLRKAGVEVILGKGRVTSISTTEGDDGKPLQKLTLGDGSQLTASHVISAISQQVPSTTYLPKSCLDENFLVKIDNRLQFLPNEPYNEYHYATGDICKCSGIKRCGAAMAMGVRAADNIHQPTSRRRNSADSLAPSPSHDCVGMW